MSVTRDVDFAALVAALADADPAARRIVAVAGPPGAGKSTFAERLREALDAPAPG
ncbi:nucleoside triphosphate hydrolase, partial [Burkholderia gladioli]